ncbi:MerR family transcriptional regulator [Pseudonocardia sp. WMMC193]|uniref:MerR family transcriptional regulator n=1 Tax=Pseudonocardia sp. WMMC193 TaxID=2911965 RepID=UPI001F015E75|nr:MerR family transcriptional regulator [Pseudonocardia sp. WMMC193]MCF7550363.1 MerR family transcriptional regulator [Pseudonocardia sp. WMMC193]
MALSTAAVASASGYSVQLVRDLEALGVLSPAVRAANGYRVFSAHHVAELRVYRQLALAAGPVEARRVLQEVRDLPLDEAVARVSGLHTELSRARSEALAARRALLVIDAEPQVGEDSMTITQLAEALGVRTSALRFWESEGLLHPTRVGRAARVYPVAAVREARIVVALRTAGHRIPELRATMAALRETTARPLESLDAHLASLTTRTLALLRAGSGLAELVSGG